MKKTINDKIIDFFIKNSNKTIIIYFWAEWCIPCKIFSKVIKEIEKKFKNNLKLIKINSNLNEYSSEKFCIKSIPTIVIIKNKNIILKKQGLLSKDYIENIIKKII